MLKTRFKNTKFFLLIAGFFVFFILKNNFVSASKIEDLKSKIQERNQEMENIQKEIKEYKLRLETTSKESSNLKNQIKIFEGNLSKIKSEIKLSQNRIDAARLSLEELSFSIGNTKEKIGENKKALTEMIRVINEADNNSLIEIMLANNSLSDFFNNLNSIESLEKNISISLKDLSDLKKSLEEEQGSVETEKKNLEIKKNELLDRQELQKNIQGQKTTLLKLTKSKEGLYKNLLADRIKKQKELEKEIKGIEEELRITIDPRSLPQTGIKILSWPTEDTTITQYFGNTPFATQNAQIYGGKGHNGIDIRANIGSRISASAEGKVVGVGDTDAACKGVSYGKWVLIEHTNNLSTLYAHLSLIKVKEGDIIDRGQLVGYAGDTGYVTGPHLHFTVFASKAVRVSVMQSKVCGTMMRLPIASYNGYLNPLSYL